MLKVTPQPQMSLTTILIKGARYGENRILQKRKPAMGLINSKLMLPVEGR